MEPSAPAGCTQSMPLLLLLGLLRTLRLAVVFTLTPMENGDGGGGGGGTGFENVVADAEADCAEVFPAWS